MFLGNRVYIKHICALSTILCLFCLLCNFHTYQVRPVGRELDSPGVDHILSTHVHSIVVHMNSLEGTSSSTAQTLTRTQGRADYTLVIKGHRSPSLM